MNQIWVKNQEKPKHSICCGKACQQNSKWFYSAKVEIQPLFIRRKGSSKSSSRNSKEAFAANTKPPRRAWSCSIWPQNQKPAPSVYLQSWPCSSPLDWHACDGWKVICRHRNLPSASHAPTLPATCTPDCRADTSTLPSGDLQAVQARCNGVKWEVKQN